MLKKRPNEFLYSLFTLLAAVIVVHAFWVAAVRPNAQRVQAEQAAAMKADPAYVAERSLWVIVKDWEQESCVVLMLWALAMIGYKWREVSREHDVLERDLLQIPEGMRILPEDTREYARQLEALPPLERDLLVVRALDVALARFGATRNVQDVSEAARGVCDSEADRLDSEMSMLRYIAWAIPAIGFIGTVRGIGDALAEAHKAVTGDIAGVTEGLGVAFNSTLIALLLSLVLMFLLHNLQLRQERLAQDTDTYLDRMLLRHLQVR
ncbi:MAG: MotA/TolQ/ExbB proton channel family protein [Steroidobacteraceae bacterium]|nr:MotA/TolQ/ExbB proton channel family protein [Steroidobacteraceae bacterium]MCC7199384.1 MotA/TolQ/ExbB proton channel family protein [Gammaproteobacteria bacterium]